MKKERLMKYLEQASVSEKEGCAEILELLYEYACDVNCLGVAFERLSEINVSSIKIQGSEEPLHVYEGEEAENVSFTYFVPVVENAWEMTNEQLEEALERLQRLELVKCFRLENPGVCAYALTSEAMEVLEASV